jgi:hypothetical protein
MLLNDTRADLSYAARLFARQPAILLLTVVGLALGLGIATAAFSVMNAAVLRGEGVVDPDRVPGVLRTTDRSVSTAWTYDEFLSLREGATRMFAFAGASAIVLAATMLAVLAPTRRAARVDAAFVLRRS